MVLLDEATSALDTVTEHSIQGALQALGKIFDHKCNTWPHSVVVENII